MRRSAKLIQRVYATFVALLGPLHRRPACGARGGDDDCDRDGASHRDYSMPSRRALYPLLALSLACVLSPVAQAACDVQGGGPVVNNSVVVCSGASAAVNAPSATGVSVTVLPGAVVDGGTGRGIELGGGALVDVQAGATVISGPDVSVPKFLRFTIVLGANSVATLSGTVTNYTYGGSIWVYPDSVVAIYGVANRVEGTAASYLIYPGATIGQLNAVLYADNAGQAQSVILGTGNGAAFYNEPQGVVTGGVDYLPYMYGAQDKTIVNRGLLQPDNNGNAFFSLQINSYHFSNEAGATVDGNMRMVRGLITDSAYGSNDGTINGEVYLWAPQSDAIPVWDAAPTGTDQRFENRGYVASVRVQSGRFEQQAAATFSASGRLMVDGAFSFGQNSGRNAFYLGTLALAGEQRTRCLTGRDDGIGGILELGAGATLTIDDTAVDACNFPGSVRGGGALAKRGPGVQTLGEMPLPGFWEVTRPPTDYSGGTSIVAGTLGVTKSGALGSGAVSFDGANAVLRFDAAGVSLANALTLSAASVIDTQAFDGTLSGTTSGTATLRKTGAGTLILSGAKNHTGITTVDGGVLRLGGAMPGAVVATTAGTLAGVAQVGGSTTVQNGGVLRPSAGVGAGVIWQSASLAMNPGATLHLAIDGANRDQVRAANVNLAVATLVVDFGAANPIGTVVKIIDNTGGNIVFDRFSGLPEGGLLYQGNTGWRISYSGGDGNDVTLTAIAVALAPQSMVATPGDRQISLAFTPPADNGTGAITGYSAQCVPGNFTGSAAASPVVVTGLTNGASYGCTVRAVNAVGAGAESATVSAVPRGPASAPTLVAASAGVAQFSVSFSAPADNGGSPVSGYQLLCQPGNLAASGAASPLGFTGLTNGQSYACALSAVTAAGAGGAAPFQVTPRTVPDAPTNLTATPYNTKARFDFLAPAFDGGANISSYTLRCPPGNQRTVTGSSSPLWLTSLTNGTTYSNCTVRATNVAGAGAVSSTASVTPLAVPSEVRNVLVADLDGASAIDFDVPSLGTPVIDYTADCAPGAISVTQTSSPILVSALNNGSQYACAVTARNSLGSGPPVDVTLRPIDVVFRDSFE